MSENSKIEWTDHTFNPWIGCTKVSPGCAHCYAEGESKRRGWAQWGKGKKRHRTSVSYWKQPLKWNDQPMRLVTPDLGHRRARVFCASLADWLDDEVPIEWLADMLAVIHRTPNLDWLLLTKRPENWLKRICEVFEFTGQDAVHFNIWHHAHVLCEGWISEEEACSPPSNVWMGTSVEDQTRADERIPKLLEIPARVRFLSCEPLLGPVNLVNPQWDNPRAKDAIGVDWVIVGGESGPKRRPIDLAWARDLRDQCAAAGVAYFFKQVDKVQSIPEDLMIRQFPQLCS